ncbi:lipoyl protein ligase domain-containing protein [Halosegnis longus]|uniref:Lipoate--protein ligase family protein n=1 Tax=Halosegnis longus TaxID=2216012 RepID=A0AAJ4R6P9_9EURY|nr:MULTISPECIES: lipoate--protein ligase family protein [Halobacteriales]RNJ25302.1 lipoate--protein ligase family protein [Salella cibi]
MRIVRGRAADIAADRAVTTALREDVASDGEGAVRAWRPHRQLAFGRRDARADGYEQARAAAREHGYPPHERDVGGRAVAYTGSTVAFLRLEPLDDLRVGMDDRYDAAVADVQRALETVGVTAARGEPPDAFCPGQHSLSSDGKLVGLAQRVSKGVAQTAGIAVVRDHEQIATVLGAVYDALDVPFDPDSVGSVARAGGDGDPDRVARALESALVGGRDATVERLR